MKSYEQLLLSNLAWIKEQLQFDSEFFKRHAQGQSPHFMWIGCSDSRVPAEQITGTETGDLFVHRNVANIAREDDMNLLSALTYAVDVLKVKHIIVCGHESCGGVIAAHMNVAQGVVKKWLEPVYAVKQKFASEILKLNETEQPRALILKNIEAQIASLENFQVIKAARARGQNIGLHGWYYEIGTGLLRVVKQALP